MPPASLSKSESRRLMLQYLERDKTEAHSQTSILGIRVWSRGADWPCPRAASLAGVYLVEELPDLYPADCPVEWPFDVCACVLREFVLSIDATPEADTLRGRKQAR
jgi:hypothetical protein